MINLRYHIVSLTAVFLALGIGLTLGSTFLDRVTVDNLKAQLDEVEADVRETSARNQELSAQADRQQQADEAFSEQLTERLLQGQLEGVPVLVIATAGTDDALLDGAIRSLRAAGADVAGGWQITDRWTLDTDDEIADLDAVLGVTSDQPDRLRRNAAIQLGDVLLAATRPPAGPEGEAQSEPSEPELVAQLRAAGFLEHRRLPGREGEVVPLPDGGARFVLISARSADDPGQLFAQALAQQLTAAGRAPVVAAQGAVELESEGEPVPDSEARTTFVGPLRGPDDVAERLSTVDDLDQPAGLAALVLAVADLGDGRLGHYGIGPGADRLLPPLPAGP